MEAQERGRGRWKGRRNGVGGRGREMIEVEEGRRRREMRGEGREGNGEWMRKLMVGRGKR